MSAKAIREVQGKAFLNAFLEPGVAVTSRFVSVTADTDWNALVSQHPWLKTEVSKCLLTNWTSVAIKDVSKVVLTVTKNSLVYFLGFFFWGGGDVT